MKLINMQLKSVKRIIHSLDIPYSKANEIKPDTEYYAEMFAFNEVDEILDELLK